MDNRSTHSRAVIAAVNFAPDVFADALVFFLPARRLGATAGPADFPNHTFTILNARNRRRATVLDRSVSPPSREPDRKVAFWTDGATRKSSPLRMRGSITPDGRGDGVTVRQRSGSLPASWATRRIGFRVRGDAVDVAATRARCGVILSHSVEGRARRSASRRRLRGWLSFPQTPR